MIVSTRIWQVSVITNETFYVVADDYGEAIEIAEHVWDEKHDENLHLRSLHCMGEGYCEES